MIGTIIYSSLDDSHAAWTNVTNTTTPAPHCHAALITLRFYVAAFTFHLPRNNRAILPPNPGRSRDMWYTPQFTKTEQSARAWCAPCTDTLLWCEKF
jgi:hypothetical protein